MFEKRHCANCAKETTFFIQNNKCCTCNKVAGQGQRVLTAPCAHCHTQLPLHECEVCPACDTAVNRYSCSDVACTVAAQAGVDAKRVQRLFALSFDTCSKFNRPLTATLLLSVVTILMKAKNRGSGKMYKACTGEVFQLFEVPINARSDEVIECTRNWLRNVFDAYEGAKAARLKTTRDEKKMQLTVWGLELQPGERLSWKLREVTLPLSSGKFC